MFSTSRQNHVNKNFTPCARDKVGPVTLRRNMSGSETTRERKLGEMHWKSGRPFFLYINFFLAKYFFPRGLILSICFFALLIH